MSPAKRPRTTVSRPAFVVSVRLPQSHPRSSRPRVAQHPRWRVRGRSRAARATLTSRILNEDVGSHDDGEIDKEADPTPSSASFSSDSWDPASSFDSSNGPVPSTLLENDDDLAIPLSARLAALLEDVSERPEFYLSGVGAVSGAVLGTVVMSAALNALELVPLLPDAFRVVGVGYVFWFLAKYLFSAKNRAELSADVQYLLDEVRQPPVLDQGAQRGRLAGDQSAVDEAAGENGTGNGEN